MLRDVSLSESDSGGGQVGVLFNVAFSNDFRTSMTIIIITKITTTAKTNKSTITSVFSWIDLLSKGSVYNFWINSTKLLHSDCVLFPPSPPLDMLRYDRQELWMLCGGNFRYFLSKRAASSIPFLSQSDRSHAICHWRP